MTDTSPDMVREHHRMLLARSGVERLRMCFSMFDMTRSIALAGLRAEHDRDLPARLFLRTYGRDFSPEEAERILARIRARGGSEVGP